MSFASVTRVTSKCNLGFTPKLADQRITRLIRSRRKSSNTTTNDIDGLLHVYATNIVLNFENYQTVCAFEIKRHNEKANYGGI